MITTSNHSSTKPLLLDIFVWKLLSTKNYWQHPQTILAKCLEYSQVDQDNFDPLCWKYLNYPAGWILSVSYYILLQYLACYHVLYVLDSLSSATSTCDSHLKWPKSLRIEDAQLCHHVLSKAPWLFKYCSWSLKINTRTISINTIEHILDSWMQKYANLPTKRPTDPAFKANDQGDLSDSLQHLPWHALPLPLLVLPPRSQVFHRQWPSDCHQPCTCASWPVDGFM